MHWIQNIFYIFFGFSIGMVVTSVISLNVVNKLEREVIKYKNLYRKEQRNKRD